MESIKERVEKLVARGWTEEDACNHIEAEICDAEDDDWFMVRDGKGDFTDLRS